MIISIETLKTLFPNRYDKSRDVNQEYIKIGQLIQLSVITQFFPPDYAPTSVVVGTGKQLVLRGLCRHAGQKGERQRQVERMQHCVGQRAGGDWAGDDV